MTKRQIAEKIPYKLLAVFLLLAAGISTGGYFYYLKQKAKTVEHVQADLATIAQFKSEEITAWRHERYRDAYVLSQNEILVAIIKQWLARPTDEKLRRQILNRLNDYKLFDNYQAIYIIDTNGQIKISDSGERLHQLGAPTLAGIALAAKSKSIIFSDFYYCPLCQHEHIDIFAALYKGPEYVGCIIFRITPHVFLYPLIQRWPTPSKSGETLLLRRDGDHVLYLNELRHQNNTAVKLRLPMTDTMLPAVMAAMGKEGMVEGHDYRGVPVAAYISHIPDSPWFMVAKVDKDEIYAPLKRQARNIWTIIILLIVLLVAVLSVLWQAERRGYYKKQYRLESEKQALIRHYDYLTKYANDIIFLLDENRRIVEVNQKGVDIYGYTHEEMIGMDAERIRVEDQRPQFRAQMEELKARGGLIYEAMHRRKDGSAFPVEISARVIEIEGKKYLQGIVRDISERKRFELEIQQRNEELEAANQELMASEEELKASDEELRSQVEDLERAQLEIKRAKEWSESIVNLAPNIVVGLGENAKILLFNKYAEKITGRRAEEVLGGKWIDLFIPEGKRQELYGVWRDIVENKRVEHYYENPIIGRNNQEFIIAWSNTVLTEDGKFKMVLSMGIDVTERKRGQEKLMESENKYRLVFEAANVGKSITLPGGEVHTNQTFCDMLGYTCEEMNHKKWQDLTPPEDIDQSRQVIDSILRGEKNSARFVKRYLRKNGSVFWGDVSTVARRDAGGKLLHFITTVVDITERKRAEDEIKSAYQNWMVSFNAMSDGISLLDAEQTILQANRALAEMAGKPIDQIIGKKCYTLMHPEGRPDENCPFDRMLKSKKREQMDLELQGRHFNVLTEPIIDVESGRITGAVHVVSDITEQKNAEQRIKAQLAELQRWQQVMLGREDRVMDLKKEINELLAQYGQPPKYGAG